MIKQIFTFTLIIFTLTQSIHAADKGKHLFILSGQSNMARLDPKVSFTPAVEKAFGKNNVIVVKSARGGRPIRDWYKKWKPAKGDTPKATGALYNKLIKAVTLAIKGKKIATVTFVWMQGEKDAREKHGDVYAASLKGLMAQLQNDLKRKDINFIIGRLSDFDMKDKKYPHWTKVRKAIEEVGSSKKNYAWINTDDLNDGEGKNGKKIKNDLHCTKAGYKILGERFAKKAIELIKKKK
ncbi:MAG: acetyl xylan esterase [Planctomycetota bacterium]|nr:MAG: acetyl xylan esterase [Planctomycetota bacterium]